MKRSCEGTYYNGNGLASKRAARRDHTSIQVAGVNLLGTYNVRVNVKDPFKGLCPGHTIRGVSYWLVRINSRLGWAMRWDGTKQRSDRMEIYSRELLPIIENNFITIYGTMTRKQCIAYQHQMYRRGHKWFQAHKWLLPQYKRHDATIVIPHLGNVRGLSILDFGSCEGQLAFALARAGAKATATDKRSASVGRTIAHHIECQDVDWIDSDQVPQGIWDIVLSLSVWHQEDPSYIKLDHHLNELRSRARKAIYIELMTPPLHGRLDVDSHMANRGAVKLYTYQHRVRRQRTLYREVI